MPVAKVRDVSLRFRVNFKRKFGVVRVVWDE